MIRPPTQDEIENTLLPKTVRGWENFNSETVDGKVRLLDVEGEIPKALNAVFVRNGPGLSVVHGTPLVHPIDGDGLVVKLTLCNAQAYFQARFVQSNMHVEESKAKRMLYKGSMGTKVPAGTQSKPGFRDPAHTNVFLHGNQLFATYEYTLPHVLDFDSLETLGPCSKQDELELKTMSAHFKVDVQLRRHVTVSFKPATPPNCQGKISFYEWDLQDNTKLLEVARLELEHVNYAHDFMLTPNWYVVHVTPFVDTTMATFKQIARGELAPGETMKYSPELPSQFVFIQRHLRAGQVDREVIRLDTEPCHIFHFANCRENAMDGTITFEACCLPTKFTMQWQHKAFLSNTADAPGVMYSYRANPQTLSMVRRTLPGLETTSCEFPTTHPFRHCVPLDQSHITTKFFYLMSSPPGQALPFSDVVKYDTCTLTQQRWRCENGIVGEPCFLPRGTGLEEEEDDGYVVVQTYLYQVHKSQFVVLNAKTMQ
ncbi:hypothetical protein BASA81_015597 [Batrachochytrium salamandrivorans]|nr:hypothetical protein BASA81_015597 [Batrachochytrium salamandrivorans]